MLPLKKAGAKSIRKGLLTRFADTSAEVLVDDGIFLLHTLGWAKRGEWNHNGFDARLQ